MHSKANILAAANIVVQPFVIGASLSSISCFSQLPPKETKRGLWARKGKAHRDTACAAIPALRSILSKQSSLIELNANPYYYITVLRAPKLPSALERRGVDVAEQAQHGLCSDARRGGSSERKKERERERATTSTCALTGSFCARDTTRVFGGN